MNQELEIRGGDTNRLIADYAPAIVPGMAGALTHAIIHLGWAIDAASPWMITEGLAYLNFAYIGLDVSNLRFDVHNESDPMESLVRVAKLYKELELETKWIKRVKAEYDESFHPELVPAGFQWHLAKVLNEPHAVATELPTWINSMPIGDLWKALYQATVYLYLATRDSEGNGNFVVLHLITSLWGLESTLTIYANEEQTRQALGLFYASLICVLSTASAGFPEASKLAHAQSDFALCKTDAVNFDWNNIVSDGISETEEHNIKLVYVMKELWIRYHRWSGFSEAAASHQRFG